MGIENKDNFSGLLERKLEGSEYEGLARAMINAASRFVLAEVVLRMLKRGFSL